MYRSNFIQTYTCIYAKRYVHTHKQRYTQAALFGCVNFASTGSPMLRGATRARHLHARRIRQNNTASKCGNSARRILCAMRTALPYLVFIAAMGGFILPRRVLLLLSTFFWKSFIQCCRRQTTILTTEQTGVSHHLEFY